MDITPYRELKIAPRAVFDALPERGKRPRFFVPVAAGGWTSVTWNDFARDIRRVAAFLLDLGLRPGERAAVFAPNSVAWLAAALGIQAAGGVLVPIYAASTAAQAAYVVEHSDAAAVFVDTQALLVRVLAAWPRYETVRCVVLLGDGLDLAAALAQARADGGEPPAPELLAPRLLFWSHVLRIGQARERKRPGEVERVMGGVSLGQPGLMLYTSGTTGHPKGVPLTHRNVGTNGLDWLECNAQLLDEGAVDLLWLPMSHIFGFGEACLGNTLGFTSYLCDPASVLDRLPEARPNVLMSVPAYWEKLALRARERGGDDPAAVRAALAELTGGRLRFCLSGGAGLKREVKELFWQHGLLIIEGYGLTECSPTLTLNRPGAFRFDSVGKPLPSVELRLAADGEILARGPNVFSGYHKDEVATAAAFDTEGWLKTGDVGRFTEDGFLQIVDRKKEIFVTAGGKNVAPANVERRFDGDPLVSHVVVYGDGKSYLVAGVWLDPSSAARAVAEAGPEANPEAVLRALVQQRIDAANAELARFEQVKKFRIMDRPLTVEGGLLTTVLKVRRKKVHEAFRAQFEALYA
ncbi:MAG: AMP-binding protein [Deltaproteobacteria bacterium]|nr:AMP-binding protein [Deltaproteobacteria bacterium]